MSASLDMFMVSLACDCPPRRLPRPLAGLWLGMKGRWGDAHDAVEDDDHWEAALVHAWLHRAAGDDGNARYWYRRAGVTPGCGDYDEEGRCIARLLIDG